MNYSRIFDLGTTYQPFAQANKTRITNIVTIITTLISASYTLMYLTLLDNLTVALINTLFTLAYATTLVFNYFHLPKAAKLCFFVILMLHLVVCTNVYVTNASGFHLYFFLVPTGVFLLFNLNEKREKILLSLAAAILYFYCENTTNLSPLINLSDELNHIIYQSVIFFIMIEVVIVMTIFSKEIESNEAKLTKQATTDALTGIANRYQFFEQGNHLLKDANQNTRPLSLLLLDLDFFKKINDKYGHNIGDICLVEISALIQSQCREHDLFARIGGEEFAIILPDTTLIEAQNFAENIRVKVAEHLIATSEASHINCTASIGVVEKSPNKNTLKNLLVQADIALYQAKNNGRNRIQCLPNP